MLVAYDTILYAQHSYLLYYCSYRVHLTLYVPEYIIAVGTKTVCELKETSTTKSITLQWNPPTKMSKEVTAYRVEYSENKPSSLKRSVDVSIEQTSFKITELLPGTEYQINVRTVTAKGTGTPTEIIATTSKQCSLVRLLP